MFLCTPVSLNNEGDIQGFAVSRKSDICELRIFSALVDDGRVKSSVVRPFSGFLSFIRKQTEINMQPDSKIPQPVHG